MNVTVTSLDIEVPRRDGGITLTSLRAFVAVVEEKSFSLAAQRLEVTQPGISVQLAALERGRLQRLPASDVSPPLSIPSNPQGASHG